MEMVPLKAAARPAKGKPNQFRKAGKIPCVLYGHETPSMTLLCDMGELHKAFVKAGESTLVELEVEGKKVPVLFKDISFEPISGCEIHADFYAVNMREEIETLIPVHFEGEAPAVKELSGVFVAVHDHVKVR